MIDRCSWVPSLLAASSRRAPPATSIDRGGGSPLEESSRAVRSSANSPSFGTTRSDARIASIARPAAGAGLRIVVAPVTVWPGTGSRSTVATRSTFTEPTTITRPPVTRAIGEQLAGDELAAVDRDDVAADPIRIGRAERDDRVRDVLRRRHPAVGV